MLKSLNLNQLLNMKKIIFKREYSLCMQSPSPTKIRYRFQYELFRINIMFNKKNNSKNVIYFFIDKYC